MPFPYKTVLITGATSGIGLALTERMLAHGVFVIAVGRRQDRLDALVAKHGADKVVVEAFDVSDLAALPAWVHKITAAHPALDAILLNAGHQRTLSFTTPSTLSLASLTSEVNLNYLSPLHTVSLFLPHLLALSPSSPTAIRLVSSGLALVPAPRCANYCATKAAIHSLAWTLRSQLSAPDFAPGKNMRVVELIPPAVQTELHSQQPDLVAAGQAAIGMPLGDYADETWAALVGDDVVDEIMPAGLRGRFGKVDEEKRKGFAMLEEMTRNMGKTA